MICDTSYGQCSTPHPDYEALMALYNSTDGANWTNNDGWREGVTGESCDPCNYSGNSWFGLNCLGNRVVCIDLDGTENCEIGGSSDGNGLNGTIPELDLSELTFLDLGFNSLSGDVSIFDNLKKLEYLNIWSNNFSGTIPNLQLPKLRRLDIGYNNFSGSVPNFSGMPELQAIDAPGNKITLLPDFNSILNLQSMGFFNNEIEGLLPDLSALENLWWIEFNGNNFKGCIPESYRFRCDRNPHQVGLSNNPHLPWEGDFDLFCNNQNQVGAPCSINGQEAIINDNCECVIENQDCTSTNHPDYGALIALYNSTDGANWTNNDGWKEGAAGGSCDPCNWKGESWYGIECENERVSKIVLGNNSLSGTLPNEFGALQSLSELLLGRNNLIGNIPTEIWNLRKLVTLGLSGTQIEGTLPSTIGNLTKLQNLYIQSTNLNGELPSELGALLELETVILDWNNLSGQIPKELGNLINLGILQLSGNQLNGNIPPELGNLTSLRVIWLNDNQLNGNIPEELGAWIEIYDLRLYNNQLSGQLPVSFGNITTNLNILNLSNNRLEGCFPDNVRQLCFLANNIINDCSWNDNNIEGCQYDFRGNDRLPWQGDFARFCNEEQQKGAPCLKDGQEAIINDACECVIENQDCSFTNHPDYDALMALYNSTDGPNWTNNDGWREGAAGESCDPCNFNSIPWYGIRCAENRVIHMDLDGTSNFAWSLMNNVNQEGTNNLNGELPIEIGQLEKLLFMSLSGNQISGRIPESIGDLKNLKTLAIGDNDLIGELPLSLYSLSGLETLILVNNELSGRIIRFGFSDNISLQRLYLSDNQLEGDIFEGFSNLSSLVELELANNNFSGDLPGFISTWTLLEDLVLFNNDFTGCVDGELKNYFCSHNFKIINISNNPRLAYTGDLELICSNVEEVKCILNGQDATINESCECVIENQDCSSENHPDYEALISIYDSLNGQDWEQNTDGWKEGKEGGSCNPCDFNGSPWYRVICQNNRVTDILLTGANLEGGVKGVIPESIGQLEALQRLTINGFDLEESGLPPSIGLLKDLTYLQINISNLGGQVPAEFWSLVSLDTAIFDNNKLTGSLSIEISNLSSLQFIELGGNMMTGELPTELVDLPNLQYASFGTNNFSGCIPEEYSELCGRSNSIYDFQNNPLLPWQGDFVLFCNGEEQRGAPCIKDGQEAIINENCECVIENQDCSSINHPDYVALMALYNSTDGTNWTNNDGWREGANGESCDPCNFNGSTWTGIECGSNGRVIIIGLASNNLVGNLPSFSGLDSIEQIVIWNNPISGPIPEFEGLESLSFINLTDNNLSGCFPISLNSICSFDPNNGLFDRNPLLPWQGDFALFCNGEEQRGAPCIKDGQEAIINENCECVIENQDCSSINHPDYVALMALYNSTDGANWINNEGWREGAIGESCDPCQFNGESWHGISCDQDGRVIRVDLQENNLIGQIPLNLYELDQLHTLWLNGNQISGTIDQSISNLSNLVNLDFQKNLLTGDIPPSLWSISSLFSVWLNDNQLCGELPQSISDLTLRVLNLSNNMISGLLPEVMTDSLVNLILDDNNFSGCFPIAYAQLCDNTSGDYRFLDNPLLPWQGDFARFCNGEEEQIGAPCIINVQDAMINESCTCVVDVDEPCIENTVVLDTTLCPSESLIINERTFTVDDNYFEFGPFSDQAGCDSFYIVDVLLIESDSERCLEQNGTTISETADDMIVTADAPAVFDDVTEETHSLLIYNRWGNKVFQVVNPPIGFTWDGTYQRSGNMLPEGTYYFLLFERSEDGEGIKPNAMKSGFITLLR